MGRWLARDKRTPLVRHPSADALKWEAPRHIQPKRPMMHSLRAAPLFLAGAAVAIGAQQPFSHFSESIEARYSRSDPIVSYVLRVDSTDLTGFDVVMNLKNAGDTVRLAMARHPEYDDRFFRYVENLRVDGPR